MEPIAPNLLITPGSFKNYVRAFWATKFSFQSLCAAPASGPQSPRTALRASEPPSATTSLPQKWPANTMMQTCWYWVRVFYLRLKPSASLKPTLAMNSKVADTSAALTPLKWLSRLALSTVLLVSFSAAEAVEKTWGNRKNPFQFVFLQNLKVHTDKNGNQQITLKRRRFKLSQQTQVDSLYASFDNLSTQAGNLRSKELSLAAGVRGGKVIKAFFRAVNYPDSIGDSISFEQPQHQVWIDVPEYLFLNQSSRSGDFSIYFRLRPYQLKQEMEIFRKLGLFEGRRRGLRCMWKKGRLTFEFLNIFSLPDQLLKRVSISTKDPLVINRFQGVLLQFRERDGSLTLHLQGQEQNRIYVTSTGRPGGSNYILAFHKWDRSPLIIGKNYLGALDEMIFSNRVLQPDALVGGFGATQKTGNHYDQQPGTAISSIYELPYSQSQLYKLDYQARLPANSYLAMFYRISDRPFPPSLSEYEMPFKRVRPADRKLSRGRYVQYKLKFYADPEGQASPSLSRVNLAATDNRPPQAPRLREVASVGDREVTLRFLRNAEMDVINNGRYHVYYGVKPGVALGVLRFKKITTQPDRGYLPIPLTDKDRLFTNDLRYQNRIKVVINNEVIREHIAYIKDKPSLRYEYPLLQNRVPYYFWVTACDNAYSEKPEHADHESAPSNHVVARPGR